MADEEDRAPHQRAEHHQQAGAVHGEPELRIQVQPYKLGALRPSWSDCQFAVLRSASARRA